MRPLTHCRGSRLACYVPRMTFDSRNCSTMMLMTCLALLAMSVPRAARADDTFSVVSANMWYGGTKAGPVTASAASACTTDGIGAAIGISNSLVELKDLVKARLAADHTTFGVVGLQEVYWGVSGINGDQQLASLLSTPSVPWFSAFGETREGNPGTRGNAIATNIGNATSNKVQPWTFAWDDEKHCTIVNDVAVDPEQCDYGEHARGATAMRLVFPGNPSAHIAWVVSVHLEGVLNGSIAQRQVFELLGRIKAFDPDFPVIVMGDFNVKSSMGDAYDRTVEVMAAADFIPVVAHLRVHMYLYDPHSRLRITQATTLCATEPRGSQTIMLSDHRVLDAVFDWR
jgi:hypothetical protein